VSAPTRVATADALARLDSAWAAEGEVALRRRFVFEDFGAAFAFMTRAALEAERLGHHPEWTHNYAVVDVRLTTHDAGGVTTLDIALASALDRFAK